MQENDQIEEIQYDITDELTKEIEKKVASIKGKEIGRAHV